MIKSDFFKVSDGLRKVFPYQDSVLEFLLPSFCMIYSNLKWQQFLFVFIQVIVDPQEPWQMFGAFL